MGTPSSSSLHILLWLLMLVSGGEKEGNAMPLLTTFGQASRQRLMADSFLDGPSSSSRSIPFSGVIGYQGASGPSLHGNTGLDELDASGSASPSTSRFQSLTIYPGYGVGRPPPLGQTVPRSLYGGSGPAPESPFKSLFGSDIGKSSGIFDSFGRSGGKEIQYNDARDSTGSSDFRVHRKHPFSSLRITPITKVPGVPIESPADEQQDQRPKYIQHSEDEDEEEFQDGTTLNGLMFRRNRANSYRHEDPFEKPISRSTFPLPNVNDPITLDLAQDQVKRVKYAKETNRLPPSKRYVPRFKGDADKAEVDEPYDYDPREKSSDSSQNNRRDMDLGLDPLASGFNVASLKRNNRLSLPDIPPLPSARMNKQTGNDADARESNGRGNKEQGNFDGQQEDLNEVDTSEYPDDLATNGNTIVTGARNENPDENGVDQPPGIDSYAPIFNDIPSDKRETISQVNGIGDRSDQYLDTFDSDYDNYGDGTSDRDYTSKEADDSSNSVTQEEDDGLKSSSDKEANSDTNLLPTDMDSISDYYNYPDASAQPKPNKYTKVTSDLQEDSSGSDNEPQRLSGKYDKTTLTQENIQKQSGLISNELDLDLDGFSDPNVVGGGDILGPTSFPATKKVVEETIESGKRTIVNNETILPTDHVGFILTDDFYDDDADVDNDGKTKSRYPTRSESVVTEFPDDQSPRTFSDIDSDGEFFQTNSPTAENPSSADTLVESSISNDVEFHQDENVASGFQLPEQPNVHKEDLDLVRPPIGSGYLSFPHAPAANTRLSPFPDGEPVDSPNSLSPHELDSDHDSLGTFSPDTTNSGTDNQGINSITDGNIKTSMNAHLDGSSQIFTSPKFETPNRQSNESYLVNTIDDFGNRLLKDSSVADRATSDAEPPGSSSLDFPDEDEDERLIISHRPVESIMKFPLSQETNTGDPSTSDGDDERLKLGIMEEAGGSNGDRQLMTDHSINNEKIKQGKEFVTTQDDSGSGKESKSYLREINEREHINLDNMDQFLEEKNVKSNSLSNDDQVTMRDENGIPDFSDYNFENFGPKGSDYTPPKLTSNDNNEQGDSFAINTDPTALNFNLMGAGEGSLNVRKISNTFDPNHKNVNVIEASPGLSEASDAKKKDEAFDFENDNGFGFRNPESSDKEPGQAGIEDSVTSDKEPSQAGIKGPDSMIPEDDKNMDMYTSSDYVLNTDTNEGKGSPPDKELKSDTQEDEFDDAYDSSKPDDKYAGIFRPASSYEEIEFAEPSSNAFSASSAFANPASANAKAAGVQNDGFPSISASHFDSPFRSMFGKSVDEAERDSFGSLFQNLNQRPDSGRHQQEYQYQPSSQSLGRQRRRQSSGGVGVGGRLGGGRGGSIGVRPKSQQQYGGGGRFGGKRLFDERLGQIVQSRPSLNLFGRKWQ